MLNLFSQRQGLNESIELRTDEMTDEVRNRLWNKIKIYIDSFSSGYLDRDGLLKYLWDRFFKEDVDSLKHNSGYSSGSYYYIGQIKSKFFQLEWYGIYDFLEFLLSVKNYKKVVFVDMINEIFTDERVPYKIIGCCVTPLISGEQAEEVQIAIENRYAEVSGHIKKALEFYKKRPVADYKNSIKESISSIEALARIALNKPNATLGALSKSLNIHPAFKKAINELYGWTSDEGGIRHSENGKEFNTGEEEARFMLVECSALVNYIISRNEK